MIYRHKKRGTEYRIVDIVKMQSSDYAHLDNADVVIYQALEGGTWWVRPAYEFFDGRFETIE